MEQDEDLKQIDTSKIRNGTTSEHRINLRLLNYGKTLKFLDLSTNQ
jgi:hypothetical protein